MSGEHDLLHVELVMSWSHEMGTWHDVPWLNDHGMSMYDMSCLNTGCLAMTAASCPCMTWHGICMKDMPCRCHHTCPRGTWGAFGRAGLVGLFSIKKVVASISTNSFIIYIYRDCERCPAVTSSLHPRLSQRRWPLHSSNMWRRWNQAQAGLGTIFRKVKLWWPE